MKTYNPKAGAPRQNLNHLLMQPCVRKQGSPGLCGAVAAVHIGAKAAADRMCPSPRRKLKYCLTSSRSKINQSVALMINHIFQFQLQPVTLFNDHGVAPVKQWFGKLIKPCGRTTDLVFFFFLSKIIEIITGVKAIVSLQCGQRPTIGVT